MAAKKSIYKCINTQKYIGNPNNIVCRSSWEYKFCSFLDKSPNIIRFASEEVSIPYVSIIDNRIHNYFIDFYFECKDKDGNIRKIFAEVKPYKEYMHTIKGVPSNKNQKTYIRQVLTAAKNKSKWIQCCKVCKDKGCEFIILTERNTNGAFL